MLVYASNAAAHIQPGIGWPGLRFVLNATPTCIAATIAGITTPVPTMSAMKTRQNGFGIRVARTIATTLSRNGAVRLAITSHSRKMGAPALRIYSKNRAGLMDKSEPVVVAKVFAENEACIIKSLLESYNIPCHYTSEFQMRIYPTSSEGTAHIRIFVAASMAEDARQILEQHRGDLESGQQAEA